MPRHGGVFDTCDEHDKENCIGDGGFREEENGNVLAVAVRTVFVHCKTNKNVDFDRKFGISASDIAFSANSQQLIFLFQNKTKTTDSQEKNK